MGDTFVERITVIDEWKQGDGTLTRLINKGAGPDVVQEFLDGWKDVAGYYKWGILTARVRQLTRENEY